jgi:hypothetical protein
MLTETAIAVPLTGPALDFNQQVSAPLPGAQMKKPRIAPGLCELKTN